MTARKPCYGTMFPDVVAPFDTGIFTERFIVAALRRNQVEQPGIERQLYVCLNAFIFRKRKPDITVKTSSEGKKAHSKNHPAHNSSNDNGLRAANF